MDEQHLLPAEHQTHVQFDLHDELEDEPGHQQAHNTNLHDVAALPMPYLMHSCCEQELKVVSA